MRSFYGVLFSAVHQFCSDLAAVVLCTAEGAERAQVDDTVGSQHLFLCGSGNKRAAVSAVDGCLHLAFGEENRAAFAAAEGSRAGSHRSAAESGPEAPIRRKAKSVSVGMHCSEFRNSGTAEIFGRIRGTAGRIGIDVEPSGYSHRNFVLHLSVDRLPCRHLQCQIRQ